MFKKIFRKTKKSKNSVNDIPYLPMAKHYVFNETGNIMLCATADSIRNFDEDIKDSFIEVSIFFTAMTKALHTTENPITLKPFSIYNYQAVKNVLSQSGMFIEINVEERQFGSEKVGASLGKELIQTLLNRKFSESQLNFPNSMFNGMNYQVNCAKKQDFKDKEVQKTCRSGNIFFVCELLMGLPQTTAILVDLKPESRIKDKDEKDKDSKSIFDLAKIDEKKHIPQGKIRNWNYKKRTYLFIPPKFLKRNLENVTDTHSPEFDDLVELLKERLQLEISLHNKDN